MKYIPYGRQCIDENDIKEVIKVLKSDWLTQGPMVRKFEEALERYCGVKYVVAVSSGTAALHLACLASGLKKGDEAITSPITFLATPNAVFYTGAKPIFADIDYNTVNINSEEIKKKITKKTKAILPVHFAGLPCDMLEIAEIAKKHNLAVIEDACHALGAKYKANGKWIKVGSCKHSDMTVFSFHPVKNITTGEGGAITTNNKKFYEKLIMLRNHGMTKDQALLTQNPGPWYYEMQCLGFNYRISDIQIALGVSQLNKLDKFVQRRREIVSQYNKAFANIDWLVTPLKKNLGNSAFHLYVLKIAFEKLGMNRCEVMEKLYKKGIGTQVHYMPICLQPFYKKNFDYKDGYCPKAELYYQKALSIPLYPKMTDQNVNLVIKEIKGLK